MFINRLMSFESSRDGFTLIEILIALGIFAIGFLAVASLQISANLASRKACEVTQASAIAADRMEEIMSLTFDDENNLDPTKNPYQLSDGKYEIEWNVTESDLNADGDIDAKAIELSVKWNELLSKGNQRDLKIAFIKHDL